MWVSRTDLITGGAAGLQLLRVVSLTVDLLIIDTIREVH